MARAVSINISLTPQELLLIQRRVKSGYNESVAEVVREGLQMLLRQSEPSSKASRDDLHRELMAGYKATAAHDRKLAQQWAQLPEAWPEK
jgi:putative addiction module CopG family antidote